MNELETLKDTVSVLQLKIVENEGNSKVILERLDSLSKLVLEMKSGIANRVQLHDTEIAVIHNDLKFIKQEKLSSIDKNLEDIKNEISKHQEEHKSITYGIIASLTAAILSLSSMIFDFLKNRFH